MAAILNYANYVGIFYTDKFIQHAGNLKSQKLVIIPESKHCKREQMGLKTVAAILVCKLGQFIY